MFADYIDVVKGINSAKDIINTVRDRAHWIELFGDSYAAHRKLDDA